jgi:hypothetical protein
MKKVLVALGATAMFASSASAAYALPGDRAISDSSPFRLNDNTLEPGCFIPGRFSNTDLDTHMVLGGSGAELHVTLSDGSSYSVDQVLVPSRRDGYKVYNAFDTGTSSSDPDVDPGQTATGLKTGDGTIDRSDVIVCVSDHGDAGQNEPYQQEDGGLVSAKNRPILAPKVTAVGASAIGGLHAFKVGFGYDVEQWYAAPDFDGAAAFATVADPNAFPSPTHHGNLPGLVDMFPRPADFPYDARRVNDVDSAREQWAFGDPTDGQTVLFKQDGDDTAWSDTRTTNNGAFNLIATLTQGDLPLSWTLRPSLAAPDSERSATFTDDDFRAWNKSWQDFYQGKAPKPSMPLVPGTNSPDPAPNLTVIVNPPQVAITVPAPASQPNAAPQVIQVPVPGAERIVTTTVTVKAAKKVTKAQKARHRSCVKAANKKHGHKRTRAKARCARMAH